VARKTKSGIRSDFRANKPRSLYKFWASKVD
jgi:hypothetical protein